MFSDDNKKKKVLGKCCKVLEHAPMHRTDKIKVVYGEYWVFFGKVEASNFQ